MVIRALSVFAMLIIVGCAGMPVVPESERSVVSVVEVPGKTQDQIYLATKTWLAESFKSSKSVIELDSRQDGLIIGNGNIKYPCSGAMDCMTFADWRVKFTLKTEIKDAKYRISFTNLLISYPGQPGAYPGGENPVQYQKDVDKVKPALVQLADSLAAKIKSQSKGNF